MKHKKGLENLKLGYFIVVLRGGIIAQLVQLTEVLIVLMESISSYEGANVKIYLKIYLSP